MNIGEVVKQLRKRKKMTQAALADCVEGYDAGNLSRFESGNQNIAPDKLAVIAATLGTTVSEIYAFAENNSIDKIQESKQKEIKNNVELINAITNSQVPLISWVQAGSWEAIHSEHHAEQYFPCPEKHSQSTFALTVRGESMSPDFIDGEIIYVDPEVEPKNGSCVVVQQNGNSEATFKQLVFDGTKKYLKALNPNWPNPIIEMLPDAHICGVVIGSYRKRT